LDSADAGTIMGLVKNRQKAAHHRKHKIETTAKSFPRRGVLKKPLESAGRNPFLPVHQASQGRQERIPDDA